LVAGYNRFCGSLLRLPASGFLPIIYSTQKKFILLVILNPIFINFVGWHNLSGFLKTAV
jgi:hypothetical protein